MPAADRPPLPSVWTRTNPRERERPALSRSQIVRAAVPLLDEEGLAALSMRTLATRLGSGAASLYRHVANKDEIIELALDEVYAELEVPDPGGPDDWQPAAEACARSLRAMALRHPWVVAILGQAGLARLGPNLGRQTERMLAIFITAGCDAEEADRAMSALVAYVTGMVTSEVAYQSVKVRSNQSEEAWRDSLTEAVRGSADDHPNLWAGMLANADRDPEELQDSYFDFGLELILDGLARRVRFQI
jgi:AcrR family transcriptional regulator